MSRGYSKKFAEFSVLEKGFEVKSVGYLNILYVNNKNLKNTDNA